MGEGEREQNERQEKWEKWVANASGIEKLKENEGIVGVSIKSVEIVWSCMVG